MALQAVLMLSASLVATPSSAQGTFLDNLRKQAEQAIGSAVRQATLPSSPAGDFIDYDRITDYSQAVRVNPLDEAEIRKSGSGLVLTLHPDRRAPAVLDRSLKVASRSTSLDLSVRAHPRGNFLARVVAVASSGQPEVLWESQIEGHIGWQAQSIDLSRYLGQLLLVRFEAHATGWAFEHAGLDYFVVVQDGQRLVPDAAIARTATQPPTSQLPGGPTQAPPVAAADLPGNGALPEAPRAESNAPTESQAKTATAASVPESPVSAPTSAKKEAAKGSSGPQHSTAAGGPQSWVLSASGLGPIKLGMTYREALLATGGKLIEGASDGGVTRYELKGGTYGLFVWSCFGEEEVIGSIELLGYVANGRSMVPSNPTDRGVRVGDPASRVTSAYASGLSRKIMQPNTSYAETWLVYRDPSNSSISITFKVPASGERAGRVTNIILDWKDEKRCYRP